MERRIGLDFDAVIHNGDNRDVHISGSIIHGAISYIVKHIYNLDNVCILSSRYTKFGQRKKIKAWLKIELLKWIKEPENFNYVLKYDLELRLLSKTVSGHRRVIEAKEVSVERWADKIVNKISYPYFKFGLNIYLDDRYLALQNIWD